jgi:hypothetical protein
MKIIKWGLPLEMAVLYKMYSPLQTYVVMVLKRRAFAEPIAGDFVRTGG